MHLGCSLRELFRCSRLLRRSLGLGSSASAFSCSDCLLQVACLRAELQYCARCGGGSSSGISCVGAVLQRLGGS
jgi:hypothetical protein